jgi:hypothetical protein
VISSFAGVVGTGVALHASSLCVRHERSRPVVLCRGDRWNGPEPETRPGNPRLVRADLESVPKPARDPSVTGYPPLRSPACWNRASEAVDNRTRGVNGHPHGPRSGERLHENGAWGCARSRATAGGMTTYRKRDRRMSTTDRSTRRRIGDLSETITVTRLRRQDGVERSASRSARLHRVFAPRSPSHCCVKNRSSRLNNCWC